ncbi:HAD family hydrolase [Pacificoceanicola onchidii]|uniref:HAD family hydrolase n=1 Tax=Pacificoceanicola onchidii TaxID=2562685 RepID=UPI0010A3187D|nr:HAD family phosphatase [Pacificoceanicola onchidii]
MIKAVVFDIGNVLIEWQPERYYDRVFGEERRRAMFAEVDLHGMNDLIDTGHDFCETVYGWAEKYPEWSEEIRHWHDHWLDLATPAIPHSVRLLRSLRTKGVPVFALTNFGIGTWAIATPQYDFLNEFDRAFVSGHMGVIKPNPRIYAMVEEESGIAPENLLFADDRADNIEAAQARGWHGHVFKNAEGWAACLVEHGLLTNEEAL